MIVDRYDGRKAGIFPEQSLGPGDHVILGRHFEPDVEEAIAARLEDLRAVGAAVERADIPGLSLEKVGIAPEDRAEIVEPPIVEHAIAQRTCGVRRGGPARIGPDRVRSEEHTSELQSLMRISYAVFCLKKQKKTIRQIQT